MGAPMVLGDSDNGAEYREMGVALGLRDLGSLL